MLKSIVESFFGWSKRPSYLQVPLTGLILMMGVASGNANPVSLGGGEIAIVSHQGRAVETVTISQSNASPSNRLKSIPDGVYLYGETPQAEQLNREYIVFEVRGDRTIGAFYLPHSEFNCFQGTLQAQQLNVTLAIPEGEIAESEPEERQEFQPVAVGNISGENRFDVITSPLSVKLENLHRIATVSENDRRILNMCKANYR